MITRRETLVLMGAAAIAASSDCHVSDRGSTQSAPLAAPAGGVRISRGNVGNVGGRV